MTESHSQYALKILGHRKLLALTPGVFIVGSDPGSCHFVISHASVSPIHAEILVGSHDIRIRNLTTSGEVRVNGHPFRLHKIAESDVIMIGQVEIRVVGRPDLSCQGNPNSPSNETPSESGFHPLEPIPDESDLTKMAASVSSPKTRGRVEKLNRESNRRLRYPTSLNSSPQPHAVSVVEANSDRSNDGDDRPQEFQHKTSINRRWIILGGLVCLTLIWWWRTPSVDLIQIHGRLSEILRDVRQLSKVQNTSPDHREYALKLQDEVREIAETLHPQVSQKSRIHLELFRASRDSLLKYFEGTPAEAESWLTKTENHLDRALRLLNGEKISDTRYDPRYSNVPSGAF